MATQLDMLQQRLDEQESEVSDECELSDESDMDVEPGEMVAFYSQIGLLRHPQLMSILLHSRLDLLSRQQEILVICLRCFSHLK
jgi:hypothetical protein